MTVNLMRSEVMRARAQSKKAAQLGTKLLQLPFWGANAPVPVVCTSSHRRTRTFMRTCDLDVQHKLLFIMCQVYAECVSSVIHTPKGRGRTDAVLSVKKTQNKTQRYTDSRMQMLTH